MIVCNMQIDCSLKSHLEVIAEAITQPLEHCRVETDDVALALRLLLVEQHRHRTQRLLNARVLRMEDRAQQLDRAQSCERAEHLHQLHCCDAQRRSDP